MEQIRNFRRRGTVDCPIAVYWGMAGVNMRHTPNAEYHPETEITLVVRGTVTIRIGGESKTFSGGDIFTILPNMVHWYTNFSADAKIWTMVFSTQAICLPRENFFQKGFVQPLADGQLELPALLQPGHPVYDEVFALMSQMEKCRNIYRDYRQNRLRTLMSICLALMPYCRIISDAKATPNPTHEVVKQCMQYIHDHYADLLTLEDIAEHCHLHPNYLCAVFKQYTGGSVFAYRNRLRLEMAEKLLRQGTLPVSKIAELSGFHSECFFYKKFKEFTGMTPKAYQKHHQKKP